MDLVAFISGYIFGAVPYVAIFIIATYESIRSFHIMTALFPVIITLIIIGVGQGIGIVSKKRGLSVGQMIRYEFLGIWLCNLIAFAWYLFQVIQPTYEKRSSLGAFWSSIPEEFSIGAVYGGLTLLTLLIGIPASLFFYRLTQPRKTEQIKPSIESEGKEDLQL